MHVRLGRRSLDADAAYCATAGVLVLALRRVVGRRLGLPPAVVGTAGIATVVWAVAVAGAARRDLARSLVAVGAANALAATALVAGGTRQRDRVGAALLLASGLEVAAFAGSQALALTRDDAAA